MASASTRDRDGIDDDVWSYITDSGELDRASLPRSGDAPTAFEPADMANKSVVKAVRLLRALAGQPRIGATVTALARSSGISRPTAFRLLNSLERAGLVDRIDNNYTLGWELARLGRHADPFTGLVAKAQPVLQELADAFNDWVFLFVPTSTGLHPVAKAAGSRAVAGSLQVADERLPLHVSSSGRVLLADMPENKITDLLPEHLEAYTAHTITDRASLLNELRLIRTQGFGVVDKELDERLLSISQPVRDSSGTLVAILTVNDWRRHNVDTVESSDAAVRRVHRAVDQLSSSFWPIPAMTD